MPLELQYSSRFAHCWPGIPAATAHGVIPPSHRGPRLHLSISSLASQRIPPTADQKGSPTKNVATGKTTQYRALSPARSGVEKAREPRGPPVRETMHAHIPDAKALPHGRARGHPVYMTQTVTSNPRAVMVSPPLTHLAAASPQESRRSVRSPGRGFCNLRPCATLHAWGDVVRR